MPSATLTDVWRNLKRDAARGLASDLHIKYVAIGTSSAAPAASDTQLGAEVFRKAMTRDDDGAADGEALFTLYLSPQDANGVVIGEVGWFAGADASDTANSGVLVARGLYSHTKAATESLQVVFDSTE